MQRFSSKLKELRPDIKLLTDKDSLPTESFQNNVLRPIIKFQHNVLISLAENEKHFPSNSLSLNEEEFYKLIKTFIEKQKNFKNKLIGIVIGLFIDDELEFYYLNENEYNKRITSIVSQRLRDTFFNYKTRI
jgi:hypothetical protein